MCIKIAEFSLLCSSRKYLCLFANGRDLLQNCHPSENFNQASHISLNIFIFKSLIPPLPQKFKLLLWGRGEEDEYSLELHNVYVLHIYKSVIFISQKEKLQV